MSNTVDSIDLVEVWVKEKFPDLYIDVSVGSCTGGKIILIYKQNPKNKGQNWFDEPAFNKNYILTLSVNGQCWRQPASVQPFSEHMNPADPKFFDRLEWRIKRILHENR